MTADTRPQSAASLLELHRSGTLAAHYPQVRALLDGLSGEELLQAGRLLARLDPDEVLRAHPDTPNVGVFVAGHGTLSALVPALTAHFARHGILVRTRLGDFDGWVFDLGDPAGPARAADTDLVLCVLDPAVVFDEVPVPWTPAEVAAVVEAKLHMVSRLATEFAGAAHGTLVLNTLPLPRRYSAQLTSLRARAEFGAVWQRANARLLDLAASPGVVVVDTAPLLADGTPAEEPRTAQYARAHLSAPLLAAYAREIGHLGRHLVGRTKKCLVLDLDNTVWGGVLGDDGVDGIAVGEGYRGEAFSAFQRVVKQLGGQGVLLAAVSKNDPEPVREVLRRHPGMVLRETDFVRVTASWRPKHESLRELAEALNLGVDSIVFVDDSPYECGLVRHLLPEVTVVQVDDDPALHASTLLRDGWFDCRELTADDLRRTAAYRDELERRDFLDRFDSIEEYLRELDVRVTIGTAGPGDVARVSQLTLRTNQFNLTQQRLQATDVETLRADPDALVVTVRSADRFGPNGLVGVLVVRRSGDTADIENFLLSCRVFSRGIEQTSLTALLRHLRGLGVRVVTARYRPTAKNSGVADLFPRYGFTATGTHDGAETFRHDLADIGEPAAHVTLTNHLEGAAT